MISLFDTINKIQYYNKVSEEYCNIKEMDIINESFKSSILNKLAKAIYDAYAYKRILNGKKTKSKSFCTFFKPIQTKYGRTISGVKWSEITDNDFKKFDGDDKELIKLIRKTYALKIRAVFIVCDKISEDILWFIQGNIYNYNLDRAKPKVYEFSSSSYDPIPEKTILNVNNYNDRPLKLNEVISLISGTDVYFLEFTDDMIESYKTMTQEREKLKEGIIYFDEQSLKEYKKKQKARLETIAKEMKAKKLVANRKKLFDDLKKVNDEIIAIYETIINNPEYIDKDYDLSRLMDNIARAYEYYYKYIKYEREQELKIKSMEEEGRSPEQIKKYSESSFYKSYAEDSIRSCEEYLLTVKKDLEKLKNELK